MKTKASLIIIGLVSSLISVIGISTANAECNASNPCGTWAMLDAQGVVTNVIVCQVSVCGGGTWAGQTVVPQVAPNPVTHDTTDQGSYIGNVNQGTSVTHLNGTFEINEQTVITKSTTEKNLLDNSQTTISIEVPVLSKTFTYEDTINKKYQEVNMSIGKRNIDQKTNIFLEEEKTILTNGIEEIEVKQESASFFNKKSEQELLEHFVKEKLILLTAKVNALLNLLKNIKYFND
jgi:hypothetical protein